jgi:hypothetical protein
MLSRVVMIGFAAFEFAARRLINWPFSVWPAADETKRNKTPTIDREQHIP